MTRTPQQPNAPLKTGMPDQHPQQKHQKADQPAADPGHFEDTIADAHCPDSDIVSTTPDCLDEDIDGLGGVPPDIGGGLRRIALRKLFHSQKFNRRDGLDDYDADFNSFQPLGNIVTSDMRYHQARMTGQKKDSRPARDLPDDRQSAIIDAHEGRPPSKSDHIPDPKNDGSRAGESMVGGLFVQPARCAHGARGLTGCRRCLAVCPAGAISSVGDTIRIAPESCRKNGLCATVCPTDALRRSKSDVTQLLASVRAALADSFDPNPPVIFHEPACAAALRQAAPSQFLYLPVDAIEAIGMDIWFSTLAFGASRVVMLAGNDMGPDVFDVLLAQMSYAADILEAMGLGNERIQIIREDEGGLDGLFADDRAPAPVRPNRSERFPTGDTKRALIFESMAYLCRQSPGARPVAALREGAPFGDIIVDPNACTLCMACVAICPVEALLDGGEMPQIRFVEASCVQCGLCRRACPENAIRLSPRMVFDTAASRSPRILNQAEAFCCVACGAPFAAKAIVDKMVQKLSGHWMYRDDAARQRLLMCWECRAKTSFVRMQDDHFADPGF